MARTRNAAQVLAVLGVVLFYRPSALSQESGADSNRHFVFEMLPHAVSPAFAVGTLGTPSAFLPRSGRITAGFLLQSSTRAGAAADGTASVTYGVAHESGLRAAFTLNFLSAGVYEPIGKRMSLSCRVSHRLSERASAAVGVRNGLIRGGSDAPSQVFLVFSTLQPTTNDNRAGTAIAITFGIGYLYASSAHRPYQGVAQDVASKYGPFVLLASLRAQFSEQTAGFVEWSGEDLNVGLVIAVGRTGVALAPALADVTRRAPRGPRFVLGMGFPLSL